MILELGFLPFFGQAADFSELEYKVKAGYLYNFAKFITWPVTTPTRAESPLIIGVIGDGKVIPILKSVLAGKSVNDHPVRVIPISANQVDSDVRILFVTKVAGISPEDIQTAWRQTTALLVGETDRFAERGGMVGFIHEENRIRLTLNLESTNQAGLKVSSRLASVARLVKSIPNNSP